MKITVIGLGYIGLPNALLLASSGHDVCGMDIDKNKIRNLNDGILPFEENGLDELFEEVRGSIKFSDHIEESDCYVIAVPTPLDKEIKIADLNSIREATKLIAEKIKEEDLIILESTVPPGTSRNFVIPILKRAGVCSFYYSHCPERAIPGQTLHEMIHNDRIIGGMDDRSTQITVDLYSSFVKGRLLRTDVTTAEFIKLMENTYRDINIALANEFALISEEIGIDVWEAIDLANLHPRVNILKPGPGVGGHCIAIDPWFMVEKSSKSKIVTLAREINDYMPIQVVKLAKELITSSGWPEWDSPKITILGMAYKGNVDDTRESPTFKVRKIAESEGINVSLFDPMIMDDPNSENEFEKALEDSDCIILSTDHDWFKEVDPKRLLVRHKNLLDTRNFLDHERWKKAGFNVKVLGNGTP